MKSNPDPSNPQILDEFRKIVETTVEANLKYIQSGSELFRDLAEPDTNFTDISQKSGKFVNQAISEYVQASATITTQLIGLGMGISRELLSRFAQTPSTKPEGQSPPPPVLDLKMSGQPGQRCQTNFLLHCNHPEPISAQFTYSMLVDEAGDHAFDVPVYFDPPLIQLFPNGPQQKVSVELKIPPYMAAGTYHTIFMLKDQSDHTFRLIVTVEDPVKNKVRSKKPKSRPKIKA